MILTVFSIYQDPLTFFSILLKDDLFLFIYMTLSNICHSQKLNKDYTLRKLHWFHDTLLTNIHLSAKTCQSFFWKTVMVYKKDNEINGNLQSDV